MKRIIGYTVFWIAFARRSHFYAECLCVGSLIFGLLLLGYFMFCRRC